MYSLGEEIHVGSWPSFCLPGHGDGTRPRGHSAASLMYAVEGQTFVVAPRAVAGPAGQELFCDTDAKHQLLRVGGGYSRIYGPGGRALAEPLAETEEGMLYADLHPALIAIAQSAADSVGHYSRPDVLRLHFNPPHHPGFTPARTRRTTTGRRLPGPRPGVNHASLAAILRMPFDHKRGSGWYSAGPSRPADHGPTASLPVRPQHPQAQRAVLDQRHARLVDGRAGGRQLRQEVVHRVGGRTLRPRHGRDHPRSQ
jgi:hypothetical protein